MKHKSDCACGGALKGKKYTHSHEICLWQRPEESTFWKTAVPIFLVLAVCYIIIRLMF